MLRVCVLVFLLKLLFGVKFRSSFSNEGLVASVAFAHHNTVIAVRKANLPNRTCKPKK